MARSLNMTKECEWCKVPFAVTPTMLKAGRKCCSASCSHKNRWTKPEYRQKMSLAHKGNMPTNLEQLKQISRETNGNKLKQLGRKAWNKGQKMPSIAGENNYQWKSDRTQLKRQEERKGNRHKEWSRSVKNRDGWKCKISNGDCSGRIESHHILSWNAHPELRYQLNNGITLCHFHHPRKRVDEERLVPTFTELILVKMQ